MAAGLLFAVSPAGLAQPAESDQPEAPTAPEAPAASAAADEPGPSGVAGSADVTPAVTFAAAQFQLESAWLAPGEDGGAPRLVEGPRPAGAIERLYTARFRHPGVAKASGLQVTVEIPAGMLYVGGSAIGPGAEISYSVDHGESFVPRAELRDAADTTHIRWRLKGEFLPGTAGLVSFRARPADAETDAETGADPMAGESRP
jgi:hypothetical protein